jgi:hypothetical protein
LSRQLLTKPYEMKSEMNTKMRENASGLRACPQHEKPTVQNQCTVSVEYCGMETYQELLKRPEWKQLRSRIIDRDSKRCRNCGATSGLEVHHKQYHKTQKTKTHVRPWDYSPKYLVTLCNGCHGQGHKEYTIPTFYINR